MFGRIFGRGKDDQDQAVCADCGRTLLAGEWTQTVVDEHGDERLICSLCGQAYSGVSETVAAAPAPANNGRMRETRSEARPEERPAPADEPPTPDSRAESDAFWQALKDKDARIEDLKAELARAEAERQELAGRFARLGTAAAATAGADDEPGSLTGDSSEPGERTWGETPAEFAAEMASLRESEAAAAPETSAVFGDAAPLELPLRAAQVAGAADVADAAVDADVVAEAGIAEEPADETTGDIAPSEAAAAVAAPSAPPADEPVEPATVFEDTQPIPAVSEEMLADALDEEDDASTGEIAATDAAAAVVAAGGALPGEPAAEEPPAPSAAEAEAAAASLTLLQRGVDLLNVSRVPRKIAETNEQLGLPHVHVGCDGQIVAVTFMWTMGWYRFHVDFESGDVAMDDRGYEELTDLQPNAGVRADGTVQLAPAQISRAAAQRAQAAPDEATAQDAQHAAAPAGPAAEPETPREAAQKPPEFLSKSLLGQRSDDESASWEQTKARDFDWDR
jgi:hypothetical protein